MVHDVPFLLPGSRRPPPAHHFIVRRPSSIIWRQTRPLGIIPGAVKPSCKLPGTIAVALHNAVTVHPVRTRKRNYQYEFHPKHHGGDKKAARWYVNDDEEFSVFDLGDFHDIIASDGYLYGILQGPDSTLRILGWWEEQVAEFPRKRDGENWHGYPCHPLGDSAPTNRQPPEKAVFQKLADAGLITEQQRKALVKGDPA